MQLEIFNLMLPIWTAAESFEILQGILQESRKSGRIRRQYQKYFRNVKLRGFDWFEKRIRDGKSGETVLFKVVPEYNGSLVFLDNLEHQIKNFRVNWKLFIQLNWCKGVVCVILPLYSCSSLTPPGIIIPNWHNTDETKHRWIVTFPEGKSNVALHI